MSFEGRFMEMLEHVGYDPAEPPTVDRVFPCSLTAAEMDFFDPILGVILDLDFDFPEAREREVDRTLFDLLVNSRSACYEDFRKFIHCMGYVGSKGFVAHIADEGPGFDVAKVLAERRSQLHLYDRARVASHGYGRDGRESYGSGGVGMYCLLTFANDFQYSPKGNEVAVRFDLNK